MMVEKKLVVIREFNEERDSEVVGKLERNCESESESDIGGSKRARGSRGVSIFTNILMGDPLCRIRFYPIHVMLVAEMIENGEIVGVVRGCIKSVGTTTAGGEAHSTKMGCILGLRVSPAHRRLGIGLKLVQSVEEWVLRNGACYAFLAIEKKNIASKNLFTRKCNYVKFSSLVIFRQPIINFPTTTKEQYMSADIKIEKLNIDQAISFYRRNSLLRTKGVYPMDFDVILKEKLSLGTWVSHFHGEHQDWSWTTHNLNNINNNNNNNNNTNNSNSNNNNTTEISEKNNQNMPSSWVVFSIWNTCKAYKFQIRESNYPASRRLFNIALRNARNKFISCFKMPPPAHHHVSVSFGFFFLYGIFGEGERLGELVESLWIFASRLAEDHEEDCKEIVTELSVSDPIINHVVPRNSSSMSRINDNWYLKRLSPSTTNDDDDDEDDDDMEGNGIMSSMDAAAGNVIVDPRDF